MEKAKQEIERKVRQYIAEEEQRNIFIEAGAGAGKSTSLVNRIYNDMLKGVPAKNIYAITFTNKATEELRYKIVEFLQKTDNCDEKTIAKKKQLLAEVDNIHISTIHKFCEDILKENAVKAGLSPDFVPVMDKEEEEIFKRVIRRYFRHFTKWSTFKQFEETLLVGERNPKKVVRDDIVDLFYSMHCTVDKINYNQIYDCPNANKISGVSYRKLFADFFDELDSFTNEQLAKGVTKLYYKPAILRTGYGNAQSSSERDEAINNLMALSDREWMEFKGSPFNYGNNAFKSACFDTFNPLINKIVEAIYEYRIVYVKQCLKYAYELYEAFNKDRDEDVEKLTNNDLVYRTYKLLESDKAVLEKTRKKVSRLFIDEYQDTDSIQYKVASMIAKGKNDCLYLVGDPKQSIYRFRGAEPDVFFSTKQEYREDPKTHAIYDLNINFRSNSKIIDWVNTRYQYIDLIDPSLKYQYSPMMVATKNEIKDEDYDNDDNLIGFYSYAKCEPADVRDLIRFIKDNKKVRKNGEYKNIEFRDIMVLLENHAQMPKFVEEFTRNNIPARVYGESRFSNTLAVRSFINLYSALLVDNKSSLAKAESVFRVLHKSLYDNKTLEEASKITNGLLNDLKQKTNKINAYGKAIYLIEHLSLLMKENHVYEDYLVNFAASKLYQMVEEIYSKGFYNGNELITQFDDYYQKAVERESLIEDDLDAVMVINLHKAKGLERPIVIWVSTSKRDNTGGNVSDAYKNGVLYPKLLCNTVRKTKAYKDDVVGLSSDESYEAARKEYVAVTRPGEAFIFVDNDDYVSLFHNENRNYHIRDFEFDDVRPIYMPSEEVDIEIDEPGETEEEEAEENQKPEFVKPTNPELVEDADENVPVYQEKEYTYTKGTSSVKSVSPSSLESGRSPTREEYLEKVGELPPSNRPKSNDVGTILHRALELLKKDGLSVENAVNLALNENIELIPSDDDGQYKAFFLTCVKAFNDWFKNDGYELYPEFGFSYYQNGLINNGSIDLLMVKNDEYIIVDYKSDEAEYIEDDAVFETTLKEKYEPQLNAYQKVVEDMFKTKNIKKRIIYFRRYDDVKHTIDVKMMEL